MSKRPFDKELFKRSVVYNVKTLYRQTIEEASPRHIFNAVALATKDAIIDAWLATQEQMKKQDPKIVYYMSMEFLMGRALGNNLINLTYYDEVKEALQELGCDLNLIEDQEPDAALGNGGLGRLAACSWILWLPWAMRPTAAASATTMACSSRRFRMAIRSRFLTSGSKTAIPLSCAAPSTRRSSNSADMWT